MDYDKEIKDIDFIISSLRALKIKINKVRHLSIKRFEMSTKNNSRKQIENIDAKLNWDCMYLDKHRVAVSKLIQNSDLLVSIEEREYNPSSFHSYK